MPTRLLNQRPVLVVDDNPDDRFTLRRLLKQFGDEFPNIIEFEDSETALEWLKQHRARCCLLDYQMPGMNGLEFLKALRCTKDNELLPVVVMTGQGDEKLAVDMLQSGAQDYLVKSDINAERLYRAIMTSAKSCELQHQLHYLAHYDPLTGLLNRSLFMDRMQQVISLSDRYHTRCALLYLDIDHFKRINDNLGHEAGDWVLKTVAERIKKHCRSSDSMARLGGDEFVVLADRVSPGTSHYLAQKILRALEQPVTYGERDIRISVSIGLALFPDTASGAQELLQQADQAMYEAKRSGRGGYLKFHPREPRSWVARDADKLRAALQSNELGLRYLPLPALEADDAAPVRLLADVYWQREDHVLTYRQLVAGAEQASVLELFHEWLVEHALDQLQRWLEETQQRVYLDLPGEHCQTEAGIAHLVDAIAARGMDPRHIGMNWTQHILMGGDRAGTTLPFSLARSGSRVVMANFGDGELSISRLSQLPLDMVILSPLAHLREAVALNASAAQASPVAGVVQGLIDLAHHFGFAVCADDADDGAGPAQYRAWGCDFIQLTAATAAVASGAQWPELLKQFSVA